MPGHHEGMVNNPVHGNHYFGDDSNIIENDGIVKSPNVVKFEVQVMYLSKSTFYLDKALHIYTYLADYLVEHQNLLRFMLSFGQRSR